MIDAKNDRLIPISEIAKENPLLGYVSNVTWWRWATKGVHGVRLETLRLGRALFTTDDAIARFIASCSETTATKDSQRTPAPREMEASRA
jgi:hypothetical protein